MRRLLTLLPLIAALLPVLVACSDDHDATPTPTAATIAGALTFAQAEYATVPTVGSDELSADDLLEVGRGSLGDERVPVYVLKSGERDWEVLTKSRDGLVRWQPAGVSIAIEQLKQRAGVDEVEVRDVERVRWPDGCFGAARPDEICTQAVTEGFDIILFAGDSEYEYRSDLKENVRPYPP